VKKKLKFVNVQSLQSSGGVQEQLQEFLSSVPDRAETCHNSFTPG